MNSNVMWLCSRSHIEQAKVMPVFVYHIPRCGITSTYRALMSAFAGLFHLRHLQDRAYVPPEMERLDYPADRELLAGRKFALIVSLMPFGFHRDFAHEFNLMTFLREPSERVASWYTYSCMRHHRRSTAEEFLRFRELEENKNAAVKVLCGKQAGEATDETDLNTALCNLDQNFSAFGTIEHLEETLRRYLGHCGLPNVLMHRLNQTMPDYRFEATPLVDGTAALNPFDRILYEEVRRKPRLLDKPKKAEEINEFTIVRIQTRNDDYSASAARLTTTETVRDFVDHPGQTGEDLRHLFLTMDGSDLIDDPVARVVN